MDALETWTRSEHTSDVNGTPTTHPVWRKGTGPGVVVVHEMPGLTTGVITFAEELVAAGHTVLLPHLFGPAGRPFGAGDVLRTMPKVCVSREFTKLRTGVTTPVAGWLRSLARELHAELGGPGVGALGMCFTGGFALAMMVDDSVTAPVLCQPSVPFVGTRKRAADLNLSPADTDVVRRRVAEGCSVPASATPPTPPPAPASTPSPRSSATASSASTCPARATPPSPSSAPRSPSTPCSSSSASGSRAERRGLPFAGAPGPHEKAARRWRSGAALSTGGCNPWWSGRLRRMPGVRLTADQRLVLSGPLWRVCRR